MNFEFPAAAAMEVPILLRDPASSSSSEVRRTVKLELDEREAADTASKEKVCIYCCTLNKMYKSYDVQ